MKKFTSILLLSLFTITCLMFSVSLFAQEPDSDLNALAKYIPASWYGIIGIIIILWDTAVLLVPTIKNYSIIGNTLKWIAKGGNKK